MAIPDSDEDDDLNGPIVLPPKLIRTQAPRPDQIANPHIRPLDTTAVDHVRESPPTEPPSREGRGTIAHPSSATPSPEPAPPYIDDEFDFLEEDENLKQRELAQKKASRARRNTRKTDQGEKAPSTGAPRSCATTGVGMQRRTQRRRKVRGYDDPGSDNDLMEWTMPDYVQSRRKNFDQRAQRLKAGGLLLPPTYDAVYFSDDERLAQLSERPDFPQASATREYQDIDLPYSLGVIPAQIAQFLRDYQVKGVAFLHELFVYQKGGILGDDMGLGKTVQVIAFLTVAYGKTADERDQKRMRKMRRANRDYPCTLIICPGTLMENWRDEFRRWGWWHVDLYHGSAAHRDEVLMEAKAGMLEVMITTYHTYRANRSAVNMVTWDCIVADECHMFKERKSDTTKAMMEVNALCRIGLTGTAIQNNYQELWTLLNWTNPGRFGPVSTWKTTICDPLKLGQSHNASNYQLATARKTAKLLVNNLLPQFFLRRTKALIKDQLPKKSDRVVFCPLTQPQAAAYQSFLESGIVQFIKNSGDPCECGSGKKAGWCCHMQLEDGRSWQSWVFPAIHNLRNIANHLAILIPQSTDPSEKQRKDLEMLEIAMPDECQAIYRTRDHIMHTANPEYCGKWRVLKKLLHFWHNQGDNKVLIFSHSVRLLKMLQNLFLSTHFNVKYLDGSMQYDDRYATVKEFNTDPTQFVFLISTKAGGVGLNITSANKVVVVDPNWNPSYDLQAQDRAYRIGQTRDVEVFRLVSQGTLEEIVYARQIYKQQQANIGYNATTERRYFQGVQGHTDQKGELFGLQNLFAFQDENQVLRDIVNKTNIAESKAHLSIASLELDAQSSQDTHGKFDGTHRFIESEEDAAISQLAAEILDDPTKSRSGSRTPLDGDPAKHIQKHDPIQAILDSVGVSYTHENSEVIGSSKVEALLSKRAEEATNGDGQSRGVLNQQSRAFLQDSQCQPRSSDGPHHQQDPDEVVTAQGVIRYKYRPPPDVKGRQFCSMASWAGYADDVVSFALVVENWTQAERRDFLDRFYRARRELLDRRVKNEWPSIKSDAVNPDMMRDEDKMRPGAQSKHDHIGNDTASEEEDDEL